MEKVEIKNILEALFFITDRPLTIQKIKSILDIGAAEDLQEIL